ncbi:MmyB family transcriptional regulator [Streptomyces canus]|uniref:MmyB family transcriptional regulator n=1 Tax=Streptomyces canus TaxID=58343 RepID=UPI00352EABC8
MKGTHSPTGRRRSGPGRLLGLVVALIATVGLTSTAAFAAPAHKDASAALGSKALTPMSAVAAMQPSWNLGNSLDAIPDETSWGNPAVTKTLLDTIKAQGFRSVRIPVTWSGHQSATAPYTIDAAWMNRVKQKAPGRPASASSRPAPPRVAYAGASARQLLKAMTDVPAAVMDRRNNVLAWNHLGHALLAGHLAPEAPDGPGDRPNLTRILFLDERYRELYANWADQAGLAVAALRLVAGPPSRRPLAGRVHRPTHHAQR